MRVVLGRPADRRRRAMQRVDHAVEFGRDFAKLRDLIARREAAGPASLFADLPRLTEVTISWPVLGFTAGISLLAAIGLGITTSVRVTSGIRAGACIYLRNHNARMLAQ